MDKELEQQMFLESETRLDAIGRFKDPSEFPWKRDTQGNPIERKKPKAKCSVCKQDIYGNVNPTKIITCSLCVYKLLHASNEVKIQARQKLLERGDLEGARSIQSFITEEESDGNLRPVVERKRVSKSIGHINGHVIRISKKRVSVGEHRGKSILSRTRIYGLDTATSEESSRREPT